MCRHRRDSFSPGLALSDEVVDGLDNPHDLVATQVGDQQVEKTEHLGLRQIFTRPYTPKTNGKAERFIQTALREWAYARAYQNSHQRIAELQIWLHRYNWHRPHGSLKANTPISRLGLGGNNLLRLHS
jgi:transposase InsO family protein